MGRRLVRTRSIAPLLRQGQPTHRRKTGLCQLVDMSPQARQDSAATLFDARTKLFDPANPVYALGINLSEPSEQNDDRRDKDRSHTIPARGELPEAIH